MNEIDNQFIDFNEYLRIMSKRRWTIISISTIIILAVAIYTLTATPIYQATVRLVIEKENPNVVSIQEVMAIDASGSDYYLTQYKIIESRTVAREVIKRLNLEKSEEFFPPPQNNFISNIKESINSFKTQIIEQISSLLRTGDKIKEQEPEDTSDSTLVSTFISRLSVIPVRHSRLVDVNFKAKDSHLSEKVVNTLAQVYIDQNLETKLKAARNAVNWLHDRVEEERKKVESAEMKLQHFKESRGIVTDFSSDVEKITAQKLAQLNTQVVDAESQRVEAETRYKQALALDDNPDMLDSIPEVLNNDLIRQIKKMEVDIYNRMSELSKKYGRNHPRIIAVQSEIDTLKKRKIKEVNRVINSLRNEYKVRLAKEQTLRKALTRQKQESVELNKKSIQFGALKREAESARHVYELLIRRFKETSLTEDMKTGNIRIVDRAEVPMYPISPRKKINLMIAIIFGLASGIGTAFFFEHIDNTVKIPEDIRKVLKIPYLGPIPYFDIDDKGGIERPELITLHSPKSTASESYRGIRTNILFSSATEPQVILVTSACPSEGKTLTSTNLAITMAQAGSKVLLIDCDMRKPKVHKMFGITRDVGMSSILVGKESIENSVVHTDILNLDIISCGPIPPNPSEIIGSDNMKVIMSNLKKQYQRIVIDSPPVTAVTDSIVLAKFVDGVVLVICSAETPKQIVMTGLDQLKGVDARILGAVLNNIDTGKESYYYYQYYYYYYGEDGHKKRKQQRKKRSKNRYA